jgi:hypothetical protein
LIPNQLTTNIEQHFKMKLIITGATGKVGGGALQSALSNPTITKVVVLSRRDTGIQHPKLQTMIKKDFLRYTPEELSQLEGADACIWALGSPTSNPEIHTQYPLAFRSAFFPTLTNPSSPKITKPFHFVLVSGAAVVRDQTTRLPPFLSALKLRGTIETDFVEFEAMNPGTWKTFVARPAMVLAEGSWMGMVLPGAVAIEVGVLGRALVGLAVEGGDGQTVGNGELRGFGMLVK